MVVSGDLSLIERIISWLSFSGAIWFLGFMSPELMEIVNKMLGISDEEKEKVIKMSIAWWKSR